MARESERERETSLATTPLLSLLGMQAKADRTIDYNPPKKSTLLKKIDYSVFSTLLKKVDYSVFSDTLFVPLPGS